VFLVVKGPAADAMDAPQPWGLLCNPVMKMVSFFSFFCVMVQRSNEIDGRKPVAISLCPPQIPHGLTRDRTRASAVRGQRLTARAMARPSWVCNPLQTGRIRYCVEHNRICVSSVFNLRKETWFPKRRVLIYNTAWCMNSRNRVTQISGTTSES
jgi:hypothetical protein